MIRRASPDPCEPTPEDIRQTCQAIQAHWTASERNRRATGQSEPPEWTAPEIGAEWLGIDAERDAT